MDKLRKRDQKREAIKKQKRRKRDEERRKIPKEQISTPTNQQ